MIEKSEIVIDYIVDGNNLIRRETYRNGYDTIAEKQEVVMNKWAFIECFEKWIIGERKIELARERRKEELEREEKEWQERVTRNCEKVMSERREKCSDSLKKQTSEKS